MFRMQPPRWLAPSSYSLLLMFFGLTASRAASSPVSLEIMALEDQRNSTPELLRHLEDSDPAVRARAALAVGRIGRAEDVPRLAPLLGDSDREVRRTAAFALGEIEDSTAAIPLAHLLAEGKEDDAEVRALAVLGLGKLRREAGVCLRSLSDPSPTVQAEALFAAWQIPVPEAFEPALALSEHTNLDLRWPATYCLMRFLGAPASGATPIPGGLSLEDSQRARAAERMRRLTADADPRVRMNAARALRTIVDSLTTRSLIALARDADWRVRVEAVRALGAAQSGTPRKLTLADFEPFLSDANPNVRVTAFEALAAAPLGSDAAVRLEAALADPSPRIRQVAFQSWLRRVSAGRTVISGGDAERIERRVRALLVDRDWTMRTFAAEGAVLIPPASAQPLLEEILRDEPRVAKTAVEPYLLLRARAGSGPILGRLEPELGRLLGAPDAVLRALTLGALLSAAADSTVRATDADWDAILARADNATRVSALRDSENDVRLTAIEIFSARSARPAARESLLRLADDADYVVRREAIAALGRAGVAAPHAAEPVSTGRQASDYEAIARWSLHEHWALIESEGGTIVARLFTEDAPITCWNFTQLSSTGFFDRGLWHRVVPDFVLQDGCPRGDGYGGPAWQIRCEINRHRYVPGALGMALSGKDTGGSQFFFTHSDQPHLDGRYTVFGQIERGQELADRITQGAPILSIRVVSERP